MAFVVTCYGGLELLECLQRKTAVVVEAATFGESSIALPKDQPLSGDFDFDRDYAQQVKLVRVLGLRNEISSERAFACGKCPFGERTGLSKLCLRWRCHRFATTFGVEIFDLDAIKDVYRL